jgi:hypothetical protein
MPPEQATFHPGSRAGLHFHVSSTEINPFNIVGAPKQVSSLKPSPWEYSISSQ